MEPFYVHLWYGAERLLMAGHVAEGQPTLKLEIQLPEGQLRNVAPALLNQLFKLVDAHADGTLRTGAASPY